MGLKRRWLSLLLAAALAVTLAAQALAADNPRYGVYGIAPEEGYTLTPLDANGDPITPVKETVDGVADVDVYHDAARFTFTHTGTPGVQYAAFLLSDGATVPKEENVRYINQLADESGTVTFTLYPDDISQKGTYDVYLSGSDTAYSKIASFQVTEYYTLGDVDRNGRISVTDASLILQHLAQLVKLEGAGYSAADVNSSSRVTITDASLILQKIAKLITNFPVEG